ncbi:hypothetical protein H107_07841 [Trichophyton rubrum CBS 202.88]|nr:hypothetical protein H102_07681 [Trichophyton rubrum CBS 100081]EZG02302.1 hypothetical protein H106_07539 [Trichophyton rubrum CBS 735.88]EZG12818.1 hypothetical protein H107_07841 [Trichophyton rubrum CBS 202.88]
MEVEVRKLRLEKEEKGGQGRQKKRRGGRDEPLAQTDEVIKHVICCPGQPSTVNTASLDKLEAFALFLTVHDILITSHPITPFDIYRSLLVTIYDFLLPLFSCYEHQKIIINKKPKKKKGSSRI